MDAAQWNALIDGWRGWLAEQLTPDSPQTREALQKLLRQVVVHLVGRMQGEEIPGPQKKQQILEALGQLIDAVITPVDLPWLPDWLVDPMFKAAALAAADAGIEWALTAFRL